MNRKDYLIIGCLLFTIILYFVFYKADDDKFMVANAPVLSSGMIPVIYDNTLNTWVKADAKGIYSNWYDYGNRKWANAVMVTDSSRDNYINAKAGSESVTKFIHNK